MPYGVKIKLGFGQQITIQFGQQDCLVFKVWAGKKFSKGIDNTASSAGDYGLRPVTECGFVVFGKVATAIELIAPENETAALRCNMPHGGDP